MIHYLTSQGNFLQTVNKQTNKQKKKTTQNVVFCETESAYEFQFGVFS